MCALVSEIYLDVGKLVCSVQVQRHTVEVSGIIYILPERDPSPINLGSVLCESLAMVTGHCTYLVGAILTSLFWDWDCPALLGHMEDLKSLTVLVLRSLP